MFEDRAGTPHISELRHDEEVLASLNVEELGLVGAAEASDGIGRNVYQFLEED